MGLIYVINASDYEPISFGDNYLYHQYDKISSFLLKNYGKEYQGILSKPVLSNGVVNWHANHDMQLSRIGDLNHDTQISIKKLYWDLKKRLDQDIDDLEFSSLPEKNKWGSMLRQVFDDENNMILSDGSFWCLLWGWKFKNKTENYRPPQFLVPEPKEIELATQENTPVETEPPDLSQQSRGEEIKKDYVHPLVATDANNKVTVNKKSNFGYKIKRFFRNFVYRYWGLLLFILLIMFIFCIVQKSFKEDCPEVIELNKQMDSLNQEIKKRCL
jgi:hypothetical protein